jgi:cyclopropane fatty-acyl-phospholipid synthase-like methyltransferase
MMESISQEHLLYGPLTARIRRMLEPVAHDSFLFFEDTTAILDPEARSGMKVFDAGCGRGVITAWLAEKECEIVAVDSSQERLDQTRQLVQEKGLNNNVRLQISQLPDSIPEDNFDLILDVFSWWHISDWGRLFNLSRQNLKPKGKLIILDTFFGWKTSLAFRQQMRELWHAALHTFNECKNMLIKREFRLVKIESIQESYTRYLDSISRKIHELEKEDLGAGDPIELQHIKAMWEWFRQAAHQEELVATCIVAELTEY